MNALKKVFDAGAKAAQDLRPGHKFTGAFGAAAEAGYNEGWERDIFIIAYLHNLPRPVVTQLDNTIISLG